MPSADRKIGQPSSSMTSICASNTPGIGTSRSSAHGLSVSDLISRMCSRIWSGSSPAAPYTPSPPALLTAATSFGHDTPPMPASTTGSSMPSRSHTGVRNAVLMAYTR
jgi:hypothetical protein